jgi:hypothetical protein
MEMIEENPIEKGKVSRNMKKNDFCFWNYYIPKGKNGGHMIRMLLSWLFIISV